MAGLGFNLAEKITFHYFSTGQQAKSTDLESPDPIRPTLIISPK